MSPWAAGRTTILLAAVALGGASCGGDDAGPVEWPGAAEQVLTAQDVNEYAAGTPERALLDWWRHSQNIEIVGFLDGFSEDERRLLVYSGTGPDQLRDFAGAIRTARPQIVETEIDGDRATVWTRVENRRPTGLTRYVSSETPHGFSFVREGGEWRLTDSYYVDALVEAHRDAEEAEEEADEADDEGS